MIDGQYIKLQLGLKTESHSKYLIALRATADYYGWSENLEPWTPKVAYEAGSYSFSRCNGMRGGLQTAGGRRHRICRSPRTAGMPKGFTNQFRTSARCDLFDLAELAHFTQGEWHWMSSPFGERISRDRWESLYQAGS